MNKVWQGQKHRHRCQWWLYPGLRRQHLYSHFFAQAKNCQFAVRVLCWCVLAVCPCCVLTACLWFVLTIYWYYSCAVLTINWQWCVLTVYWHYSCSVLTINWQYLCGVYWQAILDCHFMAFSQSTVCTVPYMHYILCKLPYVHFVKCHICIIQCAKCHIYDRHCNRDICAQCVRDVLNN